MTFKRLLGLDNRSSKYAYANDPVLGYTSVSNISDTWVNTTCGYCSVGCGMQIGVRDGRAVTVRGNPDHPVNLGKLCPKGLAEHQAIHAPNRARTPLLRKNGTLVPVTWNEAIDTLVTRFTAIQQKYGKQSLGVIGTGQLVTEEFYTLGKLVQLGFGTSNYDGNTTLCMSSAVAGYKRTFGSDGPPGSYADLEAADVVLLIGANIADNHPILCQRVKQNPNQRLIVADPRVTKTALLADLHLPLKPRSDIALINGIVHLLIAQDRVDHAYIQTHTDGFEALKASVESYTPERVSEITGLSISVILQTAYWYGSARAATIAWTMGVNHSTQGAETVNAINNLSLITGNIGRAGASPFSITGQCNAMGTRETGFASGLPGYRKFESEADRRDLAALWNIDVNRIPTKRGLAYPDIIEATVSKKVRALWVIATNPIVSFPNHDVLTQGLESLEFFVVQDGFHPTPTTERADLVLPAAMWGEKEGTYTNSERRVSKVNKAVEPPGEALPDFEIFLRIAERLGAREELFPNWTAPEDAFEEWRKVSAGRLCDYSGISYELLEQSGGVQWPYPSTSKASAGSLYSDGNFPTDNGRAKLIPIEWQPFPEQPDRNYPFILNTGRTVEHWHTRTKTGRVPILDNLSPRAWLEMNPADARESGLKSHDLVDVHSRRGRVAGVELRLTEIIGPGQLFLPFHFVETNANRVTQSAFDPISREPNYKQCAVRVEKHDPHN
jgi:anaerobic selenocysteine-containing dehydrogenase